jgi:hypothetical protein
LVLTATLLGADGNGTSESFIYNDRFQMTSQSLMRGSTVVQKYEYSYGVTDVALRARSMLRRITGSWVQHCAIC